MENQNDVTVAFPAQFPLLDLSTLANSMIERDNRNLASTLPTMIREAISPVGSLLS